MQVKVSAAKMWVTIFVVNAGNYRILILLSVDISLNPGHNEWNAFRSKGLHIIHLHIKSLLPKIPELRYIANSSNAVVIGISESKLDESVLQSEIQINNYDLLRRDRNKNGGVLLAITEKV